MKKNYIRDFFRRSERSGRTWRYTSKSPKGSSFIDGLKRYLLKIGGKITCMDTTSRGNDLMTISVDLTGGRYSFQIEEDIYNRLVPYRKVTAMPIEHSYDIGYSLNGLFGDNE